MIDYNILKIDLAARPELTGQMATGDCVGIVNFYNTKHNNLICIKKNISIQLLLKWAASGPYAKMLDYAENKENNIQLRSICYVAINMLNALQEVNSEDPTMLQMLAILKNTNILSDNEVAGFNNLQYISPASIAEVLFGYNTTLNINDISEAIK